MKILVVASSNRTLGFITSGLATASDVDVVSRVVYTHEEAQKVPEGPYDLVMGLNDVPAVPRRYLQGRLAMHAPHFLAK